MKKNDRGRVLVVAGGAVAPPATPSDRQKAPNPAARQDFFERVWDVVAEIPQGKVTTYGHIAAYLGSKSASRTVGWALKAAAASGLPCHRVVNRFGALSGQRSFGGPHIMEDLLRSEGIQFISDTESASHANHGRRDGNGSSDDSAELLVVDLAKHLWIPE